MIRRRGRQLARQMREDFQHRETAAVWAALALWSVGVSVLHFGGLAYGIYTAVAWWDLLTHALSGIGVAAILYFGFCRPTRTAATPWWLVPALLAIGAGFEVYEYLFKSFWWEWTLRYYAIDTVVDLWFDVVGALVVVGVHVLRRDGSLPVPVQDPAEGSTSGGIADSD